jgi:hypothetical protein
MKNGQTPTEQPKMAVLGSVTGTKPNKTKALEQIQDALHSISKGLIKNIYLF